MLAAAPDPAARLPRADRGGAGARRARQRLGDRGPPRRAGGAVKAPGLLGAHGHRRQPDPRGRGLRAGRRAAARRRRRRTEAALARLERRDRRPARPHRRAREPSVDDAAPRARRAARPARRRAPRRPPSPTPPIADLPADQFGGDARPARHRGPRRPDGARQGPLQPGHRSARRPRCCASCSASRGRATRQDCQPVTNPRLIELARDPPDRQLPPDHDPPGARLARAGDGAAAHRGARHLQRPRHRRRALRPLRARLGAARCRRTPGARRST